MYATIRTYLYNPRWDDSQYEVEPNVGIDTPESRYEKHPEVFDLTRLSVRDHPHTQTNYHKHIEGSAAHYGARADLPSMEVVPTHLLKWEKKESIKAHLLS